MITPPIAPAVGVPVESNPYRPPTAEVRDVTDAEIDDDRVEGLRAGQKLAIYAILVYLVTAFVQGGIRGAIHGAGGATGLALVGGLVFLTGAIAALVMSFMGIWKMGRGLGIGTAFRVVMLILMFVPLLNILLLLVVNARATRKLRQAGYKVGFLGVSGRAP